MMRCGAGAGLNIEVCGAVRVRASSLRGGAVAGQTFRPAQGSNAHIISYTCYSDASVSGYGGYTVTLGGSETTGLWTSEEANQSSSWREAEAVLRVLQENKQKLAGNSIEWFCDNKM